MPFLNRELELEMLNVLREHFPENYDAVLNDFTARLGGDDARRVVLRNIAHLIDLGLVRGERVDSFVGTPIPGGGTAQVRTLSFGGIRITGAGLDFLEDDGGLNATIHTGVVRLDDYSIKALISSRIEAANLPTDTKRRLLDRVASASSSAVKRVVDRLLDVGADHIASDLDAWLDALGI